jgi:hypothetical protein
MPSITRSVCPRSRPLFGRCGSSLECQGRQSLGRRGGSVNPNHLPNRRRSALLFSVRKRPFSRTPALKEPAASALVRLHRYFATRCREVRVSASKAPKRTRGHSASNAASIRCVRLLAVFRCLLAPLAHAVIAGDAGNPQPIVSEHAAAARLLGSAMPNVVAPARYGRLVAPERQGQHLGGIGETLETLDRKEAVNLLQLRPQPRGMVEIGLAPAVGRPHLEDDRDHDVLRCLEHGCGPMALTLTQEWTCRR